MIRPAKRREGQYASDLRVAPKSHDGSSNCVVNILALIVLRVFGPKEVRGSLSLEQSKFSGFSACILMVTSSSFKKEESYESVDQER